MSKKIINTINIFLICSILIFSLSGCYSVQSIDDLAYALSMGLDVGKNNSLELTLQFSVPSGSSEGGQGGEPIPTTLNSVECSSIDSGMTLLNSYVSKEINLSHCKIIVISEELASKGIADIIYSLINKIQIRPDTNVIISKTTSKDYIKNSKPSLENLVAKYYEIYTQSSQYTGYIENSTIGNFFYALNNTYIEPTAILRRYYSRIIWY